MERHHQKASAPGAAWIYAGIAAVLIAASARPAHAQAVDGCIPSEGTLPVACGYVFTDKGTADHEYQETEGVANVEVVVTTPEGVEVNSTGLLDCAGIDPCGYFGFLTLPPGDYLFCVVTATESDRNCTTHEEAESVHVDDATSGKRVDIELVPPAPPQSGPGTGTPGYWKNHPEAWPAFAGLAPGQINVGGVVYGQTEAIALMGKVSGDKVVSMFAALASAVLNVRIGNASACIAPSIDAGHLWMSKYGGPKHEKVGGGSAAWAEGSPTHQTLDDYNNGKLCAPHRN